MPTITKRRLDAAIAAGGAAETFVWDDQLPGFGVRLKAKTTTFLVQFRNRSGRSRRLSFARYGVMSVDEARREARRLLGEVARGIDVAESRRADRNAKSIAQLCSEYIAGMENGDVLTRSGRRKKTSTIATDRGRIERHILPLLGHRLITDVTTADIKRFRLDVKNGATRANVKTGLRGRAIVRGGAGTATRTLGLLGGIFTFAKDEGMRADNPVWGVRRDAYNVRKVALDDRQYKALGSILLGQDYAWQASVGIVLLAITGTRRGEIEKLRHDAIHVKSRAILLVDSKTGESIRPIGAAAIDLVNRILPLGSDGFVLPSARAAGTFYGGLPTAWKAIRKAAPVLAGVTMRDLRRSFSSVADELGFTIPTIKALLGHQGSSVTEQYIVKADPVMQQAADRVAAEVLMRLGLSVADLILPSVDCI